MLLGNLLTFLYIKYEKVNKCLKGIILWIIFRNILLKNDKTIFSISHENSIKIFLK